MVRVLHTIKASKYESYRRLLKLIESLNCKGRESSLYSVGDDNISGDGIKNSINIIQEGVFWKKFLLRHFGLLFKTIEFPYKWLKSLGRSDAEMSAYHNMQQYLNIYSTLKVLNNNKG